MSTKPEIEENMYLFLCRIGWREKDAEGDKYCR